MKKNGFTLLELLIGITLITAIMAFLFRLVTDIQNEGFSNTYIVENQTNRNEIISIVNNAMVKEGDLCRLDITDSGENQTTLYFTFCNYETLLMIISKDQIHINYDSTEHNYAMKDNTAYYDPNVTYKIVSLNGKKYLKLDIKTNKKGLKSTTIDDIEIMAFADRLSISQMIDNVADYYADGEVHYYNVRQEGDYKIEVWGSQNNTNPGSVTNGYYAVGTYHLNDSDRLIIYPSTIRTWTRCSGESGTCSFSGTTKVAYGADTRWYVITATDSVSCSNSPFGGDPAWGTGKSCYYVDHDYLPSTVSVTSDSSFIPDPLSVTLLISSGYDSADISNSSLTDKHITCYGCTPSEEGDPYVRQSTECEDSDPQSDCSKTNSGYVRITKVS